MAALHPLATSFASVADAYERGRPEYAPAVVGAMSAELGIAPGAAVLDLAAGTGKLTRALLAAGLDVVAVEPQTPLRETLSARVGAGRVREGLAEAIPLDDASVDAVTVADAFHWFNHAAALAEIRRVLRPGGGLAVLSTLPDWRETSWGKELGTTMERLRPQHPNFDGPSWKDAVRAADGWSEPREVRVTTWHRSDPEAIVQYLGSVSWIAALDEAQRAETLSQLGQLIADGETPAELPLHVVIGLSAR
ncbi:MAG TPA: class I SAM-dependent methyltransferase [Solirubrobacteraceae bacterium]